MFIEYFSASFSYDITLLSVCLYVAPAKNDERQSWSL
jgi:hypothetical protein